MWRFWVLLQMLAYKELDGAVPGSRDLVSYDEIADLPSINVETWPTEEEEEAYRIESAAAAEAEAAALLEASPEEPVRSALEASPEPPLASETPPESPSLLALEESSEQPTSISPSLTLEASVEQPLAFPIVALEASPEQQRSSSSASPEQPASPPGMLEEASSEPQPSLSSDFSVLNSGSNAHTEFSTSATTRPGVTPANARLQGVKTPIISLKAFALRSSMDRPREKEGAGPTAPEVEDYMESQESFSYDDDHDSGTGSKGGDAGWGTPVSGEALQGLVEAGDGDYDQATPFFGFDGV